MDEVELKKFFRKLEDSPERSQTDNPADSNSMTLVKNLSSKNKALIFLSIFIVLIIFISRSNSNEKIAPTQVSVEKLLVLSPLLPIPKGKVLNPTHLKVVSVNPKSLSKSQLQNIILESDLATFKDQLRSKKLLAPQRPILWSDVEFFNSSPPAQPRINIQYVKDSQ